MASSVTELLDQLFELVDDAKNVPLTMDKCMLERDDVLDRIDEIRNLFPVELKEAKKIMEARADMLAAAKREAETIRQTAEVRAKQLMAEDSIALEAKQRANDLIRQSEERSRELKRAANEYCEDALRRTEEAVAEAYNEIKTSHSRFRAAASAISGSSASGPAGGSRPVFDAEADEG